MLDSSESKTYFDKTINLLKEGKLDEAEKQCQEVLLQNSSDANFLGLLGAILLKKDKAREAIPHLHNAVRIVPGFAQAYEDLGSAYFYIGQTEQAIEHLEKALEINPRLESAGSKLNYIFKVSDKHEEASALQKKLFAFTPAKRRLVEALEHLHKNEFRQVEKLAKEVIQDEPNNVDALRLLSIVASKAACHQDAEKLLRRVVELKPRHIDAWHELSGALKEQDKYDETIEVLQQTIEIDNNNHQSYYLLGSSLALAARPFDAIEPYKKALQLKPAFSPALLGLGHVLKTVGQFEEGVEAYKNAIKLRPGFAEAWWSLANLKTYRFTDEDIEQMKTQLATIEEDKEEKAHFCFSLAKAYEDRKDFDTSFDYYEEANRINRMLIAYDPVQTEIIHDHLIEVFNKDFIQKKANLGNPDPAPIFILGLPRSGSTLIEQILASHSLVDGTSELQDLGQLATSLNKRSGGLKYPEIVRILEDDDFHQLGKSYIERTMRHRKGAPYFTDKMPNNFPTIGLLALILPNAKIINTRKNPIDNCLGCYKQHFAKGQAFTYDLNELGEFYLDYVRLMDHWHEVLPGKILDVVYEDFVADQENQTKSLLEFCGLPWEEACLKFYETDRAIRTASSEQVRQPIHNKSVNYWKNYEGHLQDLIDVLQPVLNK
ncbi:MAG: tetratricopeptide repeat protein [Gammaproteobacteria bacterium]|nr:tetratricopeptide repeat protein [Gammaproteobacteria bacterium]